MCWRQDDGLRWYCLYLCNSSQWQTRAPIQAGLRAEPHRKENVPYCNSSVQWGYRCCNFPKVRYKLVTNIPAWETEVHYSSSAITLSHKAAQAKGGTSGEQRPTLSNPGLAPMPDPRRSVASIERTGSKLHSVYININSANRKTMPVHSLHYWSNALILNFYVFINISYFRQQGIVENSRWHVRLFWIGITHDWYVGGEPCCKVPLSSQGL